MYGFTVKPASTAFLASNPEKRKGQLQFFLEVGQFGEPRGEEVPLNNWKTEKAPFPAVKRYSEPTALIPEQPDTAQVFC